MRAAFGLFTALPIDADPDDAGVGWGWTPVIGLAMGTAWFVFHQLGVRVAGPFVAAGVVLLLHVAVTGARSLRGMAAVVTALTAEEDHQVPGRPDASGAATAVVTLVLLIASSLLIRVEVAPAVLVMVPLVAKSAQALLLRHADDDIGVVSPTATDKAVIVVTTVLALGAAPLLASLVRPVRVAGPVEGLGYIAIGAIALVITVLVGLVARAWLRARFGRMDANSWHALGAVTEVVALAAITARIS